MDGVLQNLAQVSGLARCSGTHGSILWAHRFLNRSQASDSGMVHNYLIIDKALLGVGDGARMPSTGACWVPGVVFPGLGAV